MSIHIDENILKYFKEEINSLKLKYKWKIPIVEGFNESDNSSYDSNVKFKIFLKNKFFEKNDIEHQIKVADIVIKKWGGIKSIHKKTIKKFIVNYYSEKSLLIKDKTLPHQCVSSYSKLYSILSPKDYAIYDSRVAACLNALQLNLRVSNGYVFNYVNGRNNIIGNSQKKIGFTQNIKFKERTIKSEFGWERKKLKDNYKFYLDYLKTIQKRLKLSDLYDLEMILFSDAENQCKKLLKYNITLRK